MELARDRRGGGRDGGRDGGGRFGRRSPGRDGRGGRGAGGGGRRGAPPGRKTEYRCIVENLSSKTSWQVRRRRRSRLSSRLYHLPSVQP